MDIGTPIHKKQKDFLALCIAYKVDKMYAFGSSVTDRFDPSTSDIDAVVEIDITHPADRGEALLSLWEQLDLKESDNNVLENAVKIIRVRNRLAHGPYVR